MARTLIANLKGEPGPIGPTGPVNPATVPADAGLAALISTTGGSLMQAAGDARWADANADMSFLSNIGDPWEGAAQAAAVAAEKTRIAALFATTGSNVAVGRRGTTYDMYQEIASGVWWRQSLVYSAATNGTHHSMQDSSIGVPMLTLDQTDASFTYTGAGWATSANALTYGGSYARNATTGQSVSWVTPTATKVGLRAFRTTNGGYAKVTIDGSATAATMLPTAQDEVTAGRLASSALVAGGGTLNPTDRVYNSYGSTSDNDVMVLFAEGLTSAAHTIVLTVTGYKQTTSTDVRLYVSGGIYASAATLITTINTELAPYVVILSGNSVSEYAIVWKRTGGTLAPFIGNRHGNEVEDTFVIKLDGATVTPADGSVTLGTSSVQISRTTHLLNPDNPAETVATGALQWSMFLRGALAVHWTIDWILSGTASTAYVAMLPTQGNTFAKGRAAAGPVVPLLSDDDSVKGSTPSDTVVLWQDGGKGAVMATLRNLPTAVNRWVNATDYAWLQDRSGGDFNKGYFQRVQGSSSEAVNPGARWEAYILYRAGWLATTAPLAI